MLLPRYKQGAVGAQKKGQLTSPSISLRWKHLNLVWKDSEPDEEEGRSAFLQREQAKQHVQRQGGTEEPKWTMGNSAWKRPRLYRRARGKL